MSEKTEQDPQPDEKDEEDQLSDAGLYQSEEMSDDVASDHGGSVSKAEIALHLASFSQRLDRLKGLSGRITPIVQRDFLVADRIGALVSAILAVPGNLDRFVKIPHSAERIRTMTNISLLEKLEAASHSPEVLAAELRAGNAIRNTHTNQDAQRQQPPIVSTNTDEIRPRTGGDIRRASDSSRGPSGTVSRRSSRQAAIIKGLTSKEPRIPIRLAGATIGSLENDYERIKLVCPTDDGSAVKGIHYSITTSDGE